MPLTLIQLLPFTKLTFSSPAVYLLCFLIGSKNRQGRKTSFIGLLKLHQSMHLSPSLSFFFFCLFFFWEYAHEKETLWESRQPLLHPGGFLMVY